MTLDELIAKADAAANAPKKPKTSFHLNAAKEGLAEGIGMVADAGMRVGQLGQAAIGSAMLPLVSAGFVSPERLPEVDLRAANFNTDLLKNLFGVEQMKPESQGQEFVGGAIRGASSLPLPMGGGKLGLELLKSTLVGGAAGGGAVAGRQSAESVAPDSPGASLTGEILGGLLGGVVVPSAGGVVGLYQRATDAAKSAAQDPRVSAAARSAAENIVGRQVQDAVSGTPNAAENITEALRLQGRIPGLHPSVAEMADSPGLIEMQRRFSLTSPQRLNEEVARDAANTAAIRAFYEGQAGSAEKPGAIRSSVNQNLADEAKAVRAQAEGVAGRLAPADQHSIGTRASELAMSEKKAARQAVEAEYNKAFDAAGDARVGLGPVISKIEEILGTKLSQIKPESAPQTLSAIQQLGSNAVTLRDVDAIRKAINADVSSAMRSSDPSAAMRLRNLSQAHSAIDEAVAVSKVPDNAKQLYAAAIQKYRNEFVPRFKEGVNLQMFKDTSLNEPRVISDKFTASYFKPDSQGGVTRAMQFGQLFGKNPEARELTRTGVIDVYRQKVVDPQTGQINLSAHNAFMRDYGRTMQAFKNAGVDVSDELKGIGEQARKFSVMGEKLEATRKILRYDSTDDLISAALGSKKLMGNVLFRLGEGQRDSFQRLLMDKAWESGSGTGMQKFLSDNAQTLKMALSPSHLENMADISKALTIVERAPVRGVLASAGPDALKNATGVSMATVWAQYRATTGGRQGPMTAVFNLSAPVMTKLSQTHFNEVMQKALHDPETAKHLRDFLVAKNAGTANAAAESMLSRIGRTAKIGAGIVWDSKGQVAKLLVGAENYRTNLGRSARPIAQETEQVE